MAPGTTMRKQPVRLLVRWTARLLLLAFAALVVGALTVIVVLPRATHGSALTVLTGSMTPGIPVGSVVVVRPVDPGTLKVGDVATYQVKPGSPEYITHRVHRIHDKTTPATFIFKGDANRGPDVDPVPAAAIRGKVWFHVPYLGAIRDGLHGKGGISLVGMLVLGGYAVSQLSGAFKDRRQPTASGRASDDLTEPAGFRLQRALVLVTLPNAAIFEETGLEPDQAARQWGALLLSQDSLTTTLLVAPPDSGVLAAVELLDSFDPVELRVLETPVLMGTVAHESEPHRAAR
jgi:signal peptidase